MSRLTWIAGAAIVAGLAVGGAATSAPATNVRAQEATPCALFPKPWPGITVWGVEDFSQWPSATLWRYDPGAKMRGYDGQYKEPATSLIKIQSGTFTITSQVPMAVHRAAKDGEPEMIAANTTFTVTAGDYFATGAIRPEIVNATDAPAEYQSADIGPGEPLIDDPCRPMG